MTLEANQPGAQLYTANYMDGTTKGKGRVHALHRRGGGVRRDGGCRRRRRAAPRPSSCVRRGGFGFSGVFPGTGATATAGGGADAGAAGAAAGDGAVVGEPAGAAATGAPHFDRSARPGRRGKGQATLSRPPAGARGAGR